MDRDFRRHQLPSSRKVVSEKLQGIRPRLFVRLEDSVVKPPAVERDADLVMALAAGGLFHHNPTADVVAALDEGPEVQGGAHVSNDLISHFARHSLNVRLTNRKHPINQPTPAGRLVHRGEDLFNRIVMNA